MLNKRLEILLSFNLYATIVFGARGRLFGSDHPDKNKTQLSFHLTVAFFIVILLSHYSVQSAASGLPAYQI
jgi:predicted branched-subunit amino acid permease